MDRRTPHAVGTRAETARSARSRAALALASALLIATGCSIDQAVPSSSGVPPAVSPPAPTILAVPSVRPSEEPVDQPSASPTPEPTTAPPLDFEWVRADAQGLEHVQVISRAAAYGNRLVLLGEQRLDNDTQPAIWYSDDSITWHLADTPEPDAGTYSDLRAVTVGGPGLVAVGFADGHALVWTSLDGRTWEREEDAAFRDGVMQVIGATGMGVVGFGWTGGDDTADVIWTSVDGHEWLRATNETGLTVARGLQQLVRSGDELTAFVGRDDRVEVWRTGGRAEWQLVGRLPKSRGATIDAGASGPRGWVVTGSVDGDPRVWTSKDGDTWTVTDAGPPELYRMLAVDAGFVGIEWESFASGCAEVGNEFIGHTWASSDGVVWREISPDTFESSQSASALFERDGTLIAVGPDFSREPWRGAVWTATLPATSAGGEPSVVSRHPPNTGCGEG